MDHNTLKVLDTFAGAGGFSLGFEQAGCNIVGAVEIDSWACDTFQANHASAKVINQNILNISDRDFSIIFRDLKPDIVIGGPPCQGYSGCIKNNCDPKDPRNSLFLEFLRVAKHFEPSLIVMENIPNLTKAKTDDKKFVIDIIKSSLEMLGYFVYFEVLEAIHFGIPQIRKRLFIVASKKELIKPFPSPTHYWLNDDKTSLLDLPLKKTPTLWEAISDLPELSAGEGCEVSEYTKNANNEYQAMLRNEKGKVYNHVAMKHTKRVIERFKAMKWGTPVSSLPTELRPRKRNTQEQAEVVYDQNNRRLFPHLPSHTIPASFYANFVHPYSDRNFTAREGARIQSFPDNFIFKGKPTVVSKKLLQREGRVEELHLCQYNQIGNAVPPILSKAIAQNIVRQIKK